MLSVIMVFSFAACAGKSVNNEGESQTEETTTIRIGAMAGPTAMGMVKLRKDSENGNTKNTYAFEDFATDASAFVTPLATGEIDIAAVPSNLAANIYNKTEGKVQVVAVNTLGVLNLVERGNTVNSISDLKGKTIYATGMGAVPEYTIRYILSGNGLDADKDVDIVWCSDTTEALSKRTPAHRMVRSGVAFDLTARSAAVEGTVLPLTRSEYAICEYLALHAGQTFTKEQIYEAVFGIDGTADDTAVTQHIKNIRAKLRAAGVPEPEKLLNTVWGVGYRWKSED